MKMRKWALGLLVILAMNLFSVSAFADQIMFSSTLTPQGTMDDTNKWLKKSQRTIDIKGVELICRASPYTGVLVHYETVPASNKPLMQIALFKYVVGITEGNILDAPNKWMKTSAKAISVYAVKIDSAVIATNMAGNIQVYTILVAYTIK